MDILESAISKLSRCVLFGRNVDHLSLEFDVSPCDIEEFPPPHPCGQSGQNQ
jgi:hypothetical protein